MLASILVHWMTIYSGGFASGNTQTIKKRKSPIVIWEQVLIVMVLLMTTLADGRDSNLTYPHPEDYTGLGLTPYDIDFSGTSSGCPTCVDGLLLNFNIIEVGLGEMSKVG